MGWCRLPHRAEVMRWADPAHRQQGEPFVYPAWNNPEGNDVFREGQ
jgi:hypothetical protein